MKPRVDFPAACSGRVAVVVGSKVKLVVAGCVLAEAADMEARTAAMSLMMWASSRGTVGVGEALGVVAIVAMASAGVVEVLVEKVLAVGP